MNFGRLKYCAATVITLVLALLMVSSAFFVFSNSTSTTVKAAIPSNLLQYEYRQVAADPACTFFTAGPAPNAPNILWKKSIPGVSSAPVAFNGMVFVSDYLGTTYALDAGTGKIVWKKPGVPGLVGVTIIKIDDTYMMLGSDCVKIADGTTVWTVPPGFYLQTIFSGASYIPELKMFVTGQLLGTLGVAAWSLPDPSKPPTKVWDRTGQKEYYGMETPGAYGDGKLFVGTGDNFMRAIDVKTGNTIWTTPVTSASIYGMSYVDGKLIFGGLDNNMRAWNATTGKLLWTYNPGTWYGQWASATGAAYGMVYEHNQDNYVYAINATTGELVWRAKGPGIGYSNTLSIADGKVYVQMGEKQYRDFATGEYAYSEYDCFNAYTGELVWSLPMENGAPFNLQCVAYGNLYVCPTVSTQVPGVWTYTFGGAGSIGEVWCISSQVKDWPMFLNDPAHTADGAGPTNLQLKWKFQADSSIVSSPTIVNGVCYFGSLNRSIYAIDANSGTKLWNFTTDHMVKSTVAVVNSKVYTGADDGNIYCLDAATGAKLWQTNASGIKINPIAQAFLGTDFPRSSPMVVEGRVYVGSLDGNIYCLDAYSGTVAWKFQTGGPVVATPTIVDNAIYIPSCTPIPTGKFYKLDLNGNVIWNLTIPYVLDKTLGSGNFLMASATVAPDLGMVFLRNGLRLNYALNATTGATIWTYDGRYNPGTPFQSGGVSQIQTMLYKYGTLYFNDFYGITALNALNGSEVWHAYLSRESLAQGLSYAYGRVYTVNEAGALYVLDSLTGEKLSYYEFGNLQMHSIPTPYNGSLYVATNDWNLYRFDEHMAPANVTTNMTLSLSANSITKGDKIYITGGVSPMNKPVPITLTLDKPDSTYVDVPVMTDENGNFMVIQTFDIVGDWTVVAWWNGDETHTGAYSESLSLTVVEPGATPTPATKTDVDQAIVGLTPLLWGIIAIVAVAVCLTICLGIYTIWNVRKLKK